MASPVVEKMDSAAAHRAQGLDGLLTTQALCREVVQDRQNCDSSLDKALEAWKEGREPTHPRGQEELSAEATETPGGGPEAAQHSGGTPCWEQSSFTPQLPFWQSFPVVRLLLNLGLPCVKHSLNFVCSAM